jgi:hypothetical protein
MLLAEKEIKIPIDDVHNGLIDSFRKKVLESLSSDEIPIRFVITQTDGDGYSCELGVLSSGENINGSIFDFNKRKHENIEKFNTVLLIPTGVGCEIGGHSGDAGPISRLLASACDNLITHPNVVNAADINELPENGLFVEGSVITRLLMGTIALQPVRSNRVLLVIDEHYQDILFDDAAINSISAARTALGLDCAGVVKMPEQILMRALWSKAGRAVGRIEFFERLCEVIEENRDNFDALALSSVIQVPEHFHKDYFDKEKNMDVNPWGGVEALLTHAVSSMYDIPSAHSPMMNSRSVLELKVGVVDPRKSAEAISMTYLHCILKGLHKSPKIINDPELVFHPNLLNVSDISCLIIPDGCVGLPTLAAMEQGIPVIAVKENKNRMKNNLSELPFLPGKLFIVENYLEAVGVMQALRAGVALDTVRRPIEYTKVKLAESKTARPDDLVGREDLFNNVLTKPAQKIAKTEAAD